MIIRRRPTVIAAALAATLSVQAVGSVEGQNRTTNAKPTDPRPGEGVLCVWAFVAVAAEAGRRCRPGRDPEFQLELAHAMSRFEEYVRRNSDHTRAEIEQFERDQGMGGATDAALCRPEVAGVYDVMAARGKETLRTQVNQTLARPGQPTWGDCI